MNHECFLSTHVSCKVGHLVLQEAVLLQGGPGTLVHLCHLLFRRHTHLSTLDLLEQLRAALQGQLVQRHVVVAHGQQLRQLPLPGVNALPGPAKHDVHRHPAGTQPPGFLYGVQSLTGAVVSTQNFQILILQRLEEGVCDMANLSLQDFTAKSPVIGLTDETLTCTPMEKRFTPARQ